MKTSRSLLSLEAIEARRVEVGQNISELCAAARLSTRAYHFAIKGTHRLRPETLMRLWRALPSTPCAVLDEREAAKDRALYAGALAVAAPLYGVTAQAVMADPMPKRHAHARQAAAYLLHVGLGYSCRRVGAILGVSHVAVSFALKDVEDRRDDRRLDMTLDWYEQLSRPAQPGAAP